MKMMGETFLEAQARTLIGIDTKNIRIDDYTDACFCADF